MDAEDFDHRVGRRVRELREQLGWSQAGFAKAVTAAAEALADLPGQLGAGVVFQQQKIDRVERGVRSLPLQEAILFTEVLNCDLEDLFGLHDIEPADVLVARGLIDTFNARRDQLEDALGHYLAARRAATDAVSSPGAPRLPERLLSDLISASTDDLSRRVSMAVRLDEMFAASTATARAEGVTNGEPGEEA